MIKSPNVAKTISSLSLKENKGSHAFFFHPKKSANSYDSKPFAVIFKSKLIGLVYSFFLTSDYALSESIEVKEDNVESTLNRLNRLNLEFNRTKRTVHYSLARLA